MNRNSRFDLAAAGLALLTVLISFLIAERVYEHLPHIEDEFAYKWQAHILAEGKLYTQSPPIPDAELVPFVVDVDERRFGKYPPGWPVVLSLGMRAGFAKWVNPLLAGWAVWLVYRLGSRLRNRKTGLLAAFLTASSPMFLMLAGSTMGHIWSLFLTLTFSLCWIDRFLPGSTTAKTAPSWLLTLTAGLSLGLLAATRPLTALGVALPFFIHGCFLLIKADRATRRSVLLTGLLSLLMAMVIPLWQYALSGDPWLNLYTLWWPYDRFGFGPGIGVAAGGHTLSNAYWNTVISLRSGVRDCFGWLSVSWLFIPAGLWVLRRERNMWLLSGSLLGLIAGYAGYWVGSWLYGPRYYFEGLPVAAVLTAAGFFWLLESKGEARSGWVVLRRAIVLLTFCALVVYNIGISIPQRLQDSGSINGVSLTKQETIREAELQDALIFVQTQDSWWEYGTLVPLASPYSDRSIRLVLDLGPNTEAALKAACPDKDVYIYNTAADLLEAQKVD